jgi:hypothetical protein
MNVLCRHRSGSRWMSFRPFSIQVDRDSLIFTFSEASPRKRDDAFIGARFGEQSKEARSIFS